MTHDGSSVLAFLSKPLPDFPFPLLFSFVCFRMNTCKLFIELMWDPSTRTWRHIGFTIGEARCQWNYCWKGWNLQVYRYQLLTMYRAIKSLEWNANPMKQIAGKCVLHTDNALSDGNWVTQTQNFLCRNNSSFIQQTPYRGQSREAVA